MKTKKLLLVATMLLTITITSCKKGDTGEPGKDGTNGNANVTSMILNASSWVFDGTYKWSTATWSGATILTSDVVNNGAVMLYEGGAGDWVSCPYTIGISDPSNPTLSTFFEYQVNTMVVFKQWSDGVNPSPSTSTQYKLVCIPRSGMILHPDLDLKNYAAVKAAFDLK